MSTQIEFPQINEGVKNPFRWYNTKQKWNHIRQLCLNECMYKLTTPELVMLPFQVYVKNATPGFSIAWVIYDINEHPVTGVSEDSLKIVKIGDYYYFISDGTYIQGREPLECGYYYSQITIVDGLNNVTDWYSEIFYVDKKANLFFETPELEGAVQCLPVLQWSNSCGMVGEIYYGNTGYSNLLYLDADCVIAENTPKIIQEGFEDGNKVFVPTWKKRVTTYSIDIGLVPPYIIDALGEMILHDTIKLILPYGQGAAVLSNVTLEVEHNTDGNGCFSLARLTFEMDDITVVDKCCNDDVNENPCISSEVMPVISQQNFFCSVLQNATWDFNFGYLCNDGSNTSDIEVVYVNCFNPAHLYVIKVEVANYVSGTLSVIFDGNTLDVLSANGTYYYYISNTSSPKTLLLTPSSFIGCTRSEMFRLSTGYSTGSAWTYSSDGFCHVNGQTGSLSITSDIEAGKTYRFTIEAVITFGSMIIDIGGEITTLTESGTYTITVTPANTSISISASSAEDDICLVSIAACLIQA